MPKPVKTLSVKQVEAIKAEGRHAVGGATGLYLLVAGEGRSWILRVKVGNTRTDIGLGSCADVSLGRARERADELRRQYKETGVVISPRAERRVKAEADRLASEKNKTFKECAEAVITLKEGELKNAKHLAQWRSTLETYAYPTLGDKPVGTITEDDVEAVLKPIWNTKHETADRLRGRIENVFDYAKSKKYRDGDNPAAWKGNLRERLGVVKVAQRHQATLPHAQIGTFMATLRNRRGMSARALEFAILTAARSGEVRGATWDEIDLDAKLWEIPANRMKAGRAQEVPLSDAAVALLKALPRVKVNKGQPDFVFPGMKGGPLSDMSLSKIVRDMNGDEPMFVDRQSKRPVVPHGFRSTFREWAGETTAYPREVIEHALAHRLADAAERAYQRGTLLPKRARLMEDWAKRCAQADNTSGKVVALKGAA